MPLHPLIDLVRQQKALARSNRTRRNIALFKGIAIGAVATAVWELGFPSQGPALQSKFLLCMLAGGAIGFWLRSRAAAHLTPARCPECGHSWEIAEGRHVPPQDKMPSWDKCPGCGLLMNEAVLELRAGRNP